MPPNGRIPAGPAARPIGELLDAIGARITVYADCDAVAIRGRTPFVLGAAEREQFSRLYFAAIFAAEAWAEEHAGA